MWLFVLVRTSVLFFAAICACFALSLSTSRDEDPNPTSDSTMTGIISKGMTNHSAAPEERNFYRYSKSDESRGFSEENFFLQQVDKELPQLSLSLGLTTPQTSLRGITNTFEHIEDTVATRGKRDLPSKIDLREYKKGQTLIKTTDISWADGNEREKWFCECLGYHVSPDLPFQYMKVDLRYSLENTQSIDPKLLWWLDYVNMYREKWGAGTTETTTSNTATSSTVTSSKAKYHGVYGDKELFSFLVGQSVSQTAGKDMSGAIVLSEMWLHDSRQKVVKLFQVLRGEPTMKKLAEKMLQYLFLNTDTKPLVLRTWLQDRVPPAIIFSILDVGEKFGRTGFIGDAIFTLWLEYVEKYWKLVNPSSGHFGYYEFILFLELKLSPEYVKPVLDWISLHILLGGERSPSSGSHEKNLQGMWAIRQGQIESTTPLGFFFSLDPMGKFTPDSSKSLLGFTYLKSYRKRKHFPDEELFNMLSPANSIEEMVTLFRSLRNNHSLHDLAISMLGYILTVKKSLK